MPHTIRWMALGFSSPPIARSLWKAPTANCILYVQYPSTQSNSSHYPQAQGCEQCENKTCAQQFGDADITKCRNCSEHNIPCTPVIPDTPLPATHPSIVLVQLLNDISKLYYDDYGNQFSNTHPMWEYSTKLLAYFLHVKCTYEFLQVKAPPMPDVVPGEDGNRLWLPQRANTQRDD